jgi:L-threonylcarbamoyladenylate synthase
VDVPLLTGLGADGSADPTVAQQVANAWLHGGLVGLPTETVYGLSGDAQDAEAVGRIYAAKGRPADHPLIVHVQGPQALSGWSLGSNVAAERLAASFWPGALTLVVRRSPRASDLITGGQDTVALRCPDHRVALACLRALAEESGDPARGVAAPSANRFGRVSPTRASDVLDELGDHLDPTRDLVVDGGPCRIGVESTIVDCTAVPPRVLRLGAISQQQVDEVLAGQPADPTARPGVPAPVRAPGTLEAHYSPHARVVLVERSAAGTQIAELAGARELGLIAPADVSTPTGWARLSAPGSGEEYARDLYAALRKADELGLATVVAVLPDPAEGALAQAVRDRLARAAHGA